MVHSAFLAFNGQELEMPHESDRTLFCVLEAEICARIGKPVAFPPRQGQTNDDQ